MPSETPSTSRPTSITGGCLCGAIRYTISFPPSSPWPPPKNATCQCTICRKFTGAIINQTAGVPTANISPPLPSNESYKTYRSSPSGKRSFCGKCGGSLTFCYDATPEETEIFLGSVDEEVLRGEWGRALCETRRHLWLENAVKGVTDGMKGRKYLTDESGGEGFE
ncbi:hypothetical protein H2201_006095 [Coniosporium apollinis]|uniref:CENP-V/GFA domain-containing protein n=1 Tax=Coniosporium apollinis TaxID=61459 RepID=A0ABQ9NT59_9PEZI|nr:hypothetical protein H2201_006095 [Coniosporium apollinis]